MTATGLATLPIIYRYLSRGHRCARPVPREMRAVRPRCARGESAPIVRNRRSREARDFGSGPGPVESRQQVRLDVRVEAGPDLRLAAEAGELGRCGVVEESPDRRGQSLGIIGGDEDAGPVMVDEGMEPLDGGGDAG